MEEHAPGEVDDDLWPDEELLVTEDAAPLDGVYQEKMQRLLASALHDSWPGPVDADGQPRPFVAMANVGLFFHPEDPPLVPDHLLSADVRLPADVKAKRGRSYFTWRYGKPPDVVVEVVSNREGRELDHKLAIYERIRVAHYVVFAPFGSLGEVRVRCFELHGQRYVDRLDPRFEALGLSLVEWDGVFEDLPSTWLRWATLDGVPILTGRERAEQERERAEQERERAEQEHERAEQEHDRAEQEHDRAEQERERAERLAARLRALGIDPDEV
ncbi:MAG: Uma2 family endonuclease [Sandaracinaceae bacterium]